MLLGLDVSTSITGATVLDENQNIVYCESWDTRNSKKFPSLFAKAQFIKTKLLEIRESFSIKDVFIEENLQSFRSGFSSAKTLSTLAKINGIVSFVCCEVFDKEPEFIAPTTARKWCGITVPRGENAKKIVLEYVLDNDPTFVVELTSYNNPRPGTYDRADSIVIAKAGFEICRLKNLYF